MEERPVLWSCERRPSLSRTPGSTLVLRALLRWSGVPADDVLDSRLDWTDDDA